MRRCVVVDDDEVTRELAVVFAVEAGWEAEAAGSGEELLQQPSRQAPAAVLADLRMPGLCGPALAAALRQRFGVGTRLVCMSADRPDEAAWAGFDAFLPKPFTVEALSAVLGAETESEASPVLGESAYRSLAGSMPAAQLRELYALCLQDAEARIDRMRTLQSLGDGDGYRRAAHAIKGSCAMVGALELAGLAEAMEEHGPDPSGSTVSLELFLRAAARLRHTLLVTSGVT